MGKKGKRKGGRGRGGRVWNCSIVCYSSARSPMEHWESGMSVPLADFSTGRGLIDHGCCTLSTSPSEQRGGRRGQRFHPVGCFPSTLPQKEIFSSGIFDWSFASELCTTCTCLADLQLRSLRCATRLLIFPATVSAFPVALSSFLRQACVPSFNPFKRRARTNLFYEG